MDSEESNAKEHEGIPLDTAQDCINNFGHRTTSSSHSAISDELDNPSELIPTENEDHLPIEMQCEQVDMDDPKLDLLEWMVRKLIPIPRAYYWETENYDLPIRTKAWHRVVGGLHAVVKWTDRVGQPLVNATGLTASRFDYVASTMTEQQIQKTKETAKEQRLRHQANYMANSSEEGTSVGLVIDPNPP